MRQYSIPVRSLIFIVCIIPMALLFSACNGSGSGSGSGSNDQEMANEKIVQRYFDELMNQNIIEITPEIINEDILYHRAKHKGNRKGMEDYIQYIQLNNLHFPDLRFETEDIISDDNKVVVRFTATGTYQTNGQKVVVEGIRIFEIKDDKIIEIWEQMDDVSIMTKLEVLEDDYQETFKALMDYSFPTSEELELKGGSTGEPEFKGGSMDLSK